MQRRSTLTTLTPPQAWPVRASIIPVSQKGRPAMVILDMKFRPLYVPFAIVHPHPQLILGATNPMSNHIWAIDMYSQVLNRHITIC